MNEIYVCDALMGSGKTSAAINYMNAHPEKKYIYISPYLKQLERITEACPDLHFRQPYNTIEQYDYRKTEHLFALVKEGRNIAATHRAFILMSDELSLEIKRWGYTLIIDEDMQLWEKVDILKTQDIHWLIRSGVLTLDGDRLVLSGEEFLVEGTAYYEALSLISQRDIYVTNVESNPQLMYWEMSPQVIFACKEIFVLTYMFENQNLHSLFLMNNLKYNNIGVACIDDEYRFTDTVQPVADKAKNIINKIHILEHPKLNVIGQQNLNGTGKRTQLSYSWFDKHIGDDKGKRLRLNLDNYFRNICGDIPASEKLWTCPKEYKDKIGGKRYQNCFLSFNARATNDYADKTNLAYLLNVYMDPCKVQYFKKQGVIIDQDKYALSCMMQWIWRSAIRNGEEIYIYIPSLRMRTLLVNWMNEITQKERSDKNEK